MIVNCAMKYWVAIAFLVVAPIVILIVVRHRKRKARVRFDDLLTSRLGLGEGRVSGIRASPWTRDRRPQ